MYKSITLWMFSVCFDRLYLLFT